MWVYSVLLISHRQTTGKKKKTCVLLLLFGVLCQTDELVCSCGIYIMYVILNV